ncbi:MAG TPA: DUF4398 domain-containing protein [Burkholderiales bacterium]|nr:DUF4398 domain-containing protein [Burkholderiales bacterium]
MRALYCLGAALLASCAMSPLANDSLEQARAAVHAVQADTRVAQHAAPELDLASRALRDAERAPLAERMHRAYLAEQRARIARELASARANAAQAASGR